MMGERHNNFRSLRFVRDPSEGKKIIIMKLINRAKYNLLWICLCYQFL